MVCNTNILNPLYGDWDVYYVPHRKSSPKYPSDITAWLNKQATKIGAEGEWAESSKQIYFNFLSTG